MCSVVPVVRVVFRGRTVMVPDMLRSQGHDVATAQRRIEHQGHRHPRPRPDRVLRLVSRDIFLAPAVKPLVFGSDPCGRARPADCGYPCQKPEASSARRETTLQREIAMKNVSLGIFDPSLGIFDPARCRRNPNFLGGFPPKPRSVLRNRQGIPRLSGVSSRTHKEKRTPVQPKPPHDSKRNSMQRRKRQHDSRLPLPNKPNNAPLPKPPHGNRPSRDSSAPPSERPRDSSMRKLAGIRGSHLARSNGCKEVREQGLI